MEKGPRDPEGCPQMAADQRRQTDVRAKRFSKELAVMLTRERGSKPAGEAVSSADPRNRGIEQVCYRTARAGSAHDRAGRTASRRTAPAAEAACVVLAAMFPDVPFELRTREELEKLAEIAEESVHG
jgi:hypothetical protein